MSDFITRNFGGDNDINSTGSGKKKVHRVKPKRNQIPSAILESTALHRAMEILPKNYNFEIYKTIWRVLSLKSKAS